MEKQVIKRDGSVVEFDSSKIYTAIMKAMTNGSGIVEEQVASVISKQAECLFEGNSTVSINVIEKFVFDQLIEFDQKETARAYEGYRATQSYKRESLNNELVKSVLGLIDQTNEEVILENANKQAELAPTQRDLIAGEVSKMISKNFLIPPHLVQANDMGIIKIHE